MVSQNSSDLSRMYAPILSPAKLSNWLEWFYSSPKLFSWKVWFSEQSGFRTKLCEMGHAPFSAPSVARNTIWEFLLVFNSSYVSVRLTCNCLWKWHRVVSSFCGAISDTTDFVRFRTVSEQNLQIWAFSEAWPPKGTHRMRDFVCFPSGAHPEVPRKSWRPRWSDPFLQSTRVLQTPRICIFSEQTRLGFVLTTATALVFPTEIGENVHRPQYRKLFFVLFVMF